MGMKQTWYSGNRYKGEWRKDVKHGFGIKAWANGDRYEGTWTEGTKHGQCYSLRVACIFRSRTTLTNTIILLLLSIGKGVYIWKNGDKYVGEWEHDKKHGKGVFVFSNGRKKEGYWQNDFKHVRHFHISRWNSCDLGI